MTVCCALHTALPHPPRARAGPEPRQVDDLNTWHMPRHHRHTARAPWPPAWPLKRTWHATQGGSAAKAARNNPPCLPACRGCTAWRHDKQQCPHAPHAAHAHTCTRPRGDMNLSHAMIPSSSCTLCKAKEHLCTLHLSAARACCTLGGNPYAAPSCICASSPPPRATRRCSTTRR